MPGRLIFGVETEYGAVFRTNGNGGETANEDRSLVGGLLELASASLPCLEGERGGLFLENGARFYIDAGAHPEYATGECVNPEDLVCHVAAGDALLARLAGDLRIRDDLSEAAVTKNNVDYISRTSWGFHENYRLEQSSHPELADWLVGHLVSRVIYSGGGGFSFGGKSGACFSLSPRAAFLNEVMSSASTKDRGIFHEKHEALADSGDRLHVICGENLCSQKALWLRVGATALVAALLDRGIRPKSCVMLKDPLSALRVVCRDVSLGGLVQLADGTTITAVSLQARYVDFVEQHLGETSMPDWASQVVRSWRATLDLLLSRGYAGVAPYLDWAIKYSVYSEMLQRGGLDWERFRWIAMAVRDTHSGVAEPKTAKDAGPESRRKAVEDRLRVLGLSGVGSGEEVDLCIRVLELDMRFGRLGNGVFCELDRRGVLGHRLPGGSDEAIRRATCVPPEGTRAWFRGTAIRALSDERSSFRCNWDHILDLRCPRMIDLRDVFASCAGWKEITEGEFNELKGIDASSGLSAAIERRVCALAYQRYADGDYDAAWRALESSGELETADLLVERLRLVAWVQGRRGDLAAALGALQRLPQRAREHMKTVVDHIFVLGFTLLCPDPAIEPWVDKGIHMLADEEGDVRNYASWFWGLVAFCRLRQGMMPKAEEALRAAMAAVHFEHAGPHTVPRVQCQEAEILRRKGLLGESWLVLMRAKEYCEQRGFRGDLADMVLCGLAKIQDDRLAAVSHLEAAIDIQARSGGRVAECRSQILAARFEGSERGARRLSRIGQLRSETRALARCPTLKKIMGNWNEWVAGVPDPEGGADAYWNI